MSNASSNYLLSHYFNTGRNITY